MNDGHEIEPPIEPRVDRAVDGGTPTLGPLGDEPATRYALVPIARSLPPIGDHMAMVLLPSHELGSVPPARHRARGSVLGRVLMIAAIVVVVAGIGVGGVYALRPQPSPFLAAAAGSAPALPTVPVAPSSSPSPTPSPSATKATGPEHSARASSSPKTHTAPSPSHSPSPSPQVTTDPVKVVTGAIVLPSVGWCLDDTSQNTSNGNVIQLFPCNQTAAQVWTFAADGTLRIFDKCMQVQPAAAGGDTVLWDCDGSASERWASQGNGEIVNGATGLCLALPTSFRGGNIQLEITTCTDSAYQRWTLPS